jgi:hypothetical protein
MLLRYPEILHCILKLSIFGGEIFINLASRENNTAKAPAVLLSSHISYLVFNIYANIFLPPKVRSCKGRPMASFSD